MKPLALCLLLFTGCASPNVWYQSGKTDLELRQDWAASQLAGQQAGANVHAPFVLDSNVALGLSIRASRDAGSAAKKVSILTMEAKGYQLVPRASVPTNAPYLKP